MKSTTPTDGAGENGANALELEAYLPHRLTVTSKRISRLIARKYSETYGLTISELGVLTTVGRAGTMSPTAVGESTSMDKVKVSRAAASLVGRGLLRQSQDPNDGRGRLLRLTRKGATIHNGIVPLAKEIEASLAEGLSRSEWASLTKALSKLDTHLQHIESAEAEAG